MEIATNTTKHSTTYTPTKQKDSSSHDKPFHQYMNKENQNETSVKKGYVEVTNKTTQPTQTATYSKDTAQTKSESYDTKKEFLNFLDENLPGFFEKNGIPKKDEEAIRKVLSDNLITEAEAKQLSFEQAQTFHKMQFNHYEYRLKDPEKMMIIPFENNFVHSILGVTVDTKDDTFNKAIHKTLVENYSSTTFVNNYMLAEIIYTLKQAYTGMDLGFNYHQAPVPFGMLQDFENSEMDYEKHLLKILDLAKTNLQKEKDPSTREHLGDLTKGFALILNNYQELTENGNK